MAGDYRRIFDRYLGVFAFLGMLIAFELLGFQFGWLDAFAFLALTPTAVGLFLAGRWALVSARGRRLLPRFGMRHLMVVVLVAAILMQMARAMGWSLLWLVAFLVPPLLVMGLWPFFRTRTRTEQDGLIAVLGMAARRGLPLGPAASAYAGLCGGLYRDLVRAFAERLEAGATLSQALNAYPAVLPAEVAAVARAGWDTNRLGEALREAAEARRSGRDRAPSVLRMLAYPAALLWVVLGVLGFLDYFVAPKMRVIFSDFSRELPAGTVLDMPEPARTASAVLGAVNGAILVPFRLAGSLIRDTLAAAGIDPGPEITVMILTLITILLQLGLLFLFVRYVVWTALAFLGWRDARLRTVRFWPRWLTRRSFTRDAAAVLRGLALGVEAGTPMPEVLDRLARSDLARRVRFAVRYAEADIKAGKEWVASLRNRGLIRPADAAVLASAERVGNLAWALRDRADAIDRRRTLRLRALAVVVQPVAVVAIGLLVLMAALAYFLPMLAILSNLAEAMP